MVWDREVQVPYAVTVKDAMHQMHHWEKKKGFLFKNEAEDFMWMFLEVESLYEAYFQKEAKYRDETQYNKSFDKLFSFLEDKFNRKAVKDWKKETEDGLFDG
jgi:hypothetical protein